MVWETLVLKPGFAFGLVKPVRTEQYQVLLNGVGFLIVIMELEELKFGR